MHSVFDRTGCLAPARIGYSDTDPRIRLGCHCRGLSGHYSHDLLPWRGRARSRRPRGQMQICDSCGRGPVRDGQGPCGPPALDVMSRDVVRLLVGESP